MRLYTPMVRVLNRGEPILAFTFLTLSACAAILLVWGAGANYCDRLGRAQGRSCG
jgi:hypothetical protein